MEIETYRGAPFLYRKEEIDFLVEFFNRVPQRVLWVYGPKSSGKTTIISYVVDNYLLKEKKKFWVKYLNLREKIITSYRSFLDSFFMPEELYNREIKRDVEFSVKIFRVRREDLKSLKQRETDWGKVLMDEVKRGADKGKRCVIIIDEIQKLRDVYIKNGNGERELLKEFLNLCISLTKERHLAHVTILTSNTVFIEKIYNDARMKKTGEFYRIGHLDKGQVVEWLGKEGLIETEIELVWDYLGGCVADILKLFEHLKSREFVLKKYLEQEAWLAYTEIVELFRKIEDKELKEGFKSMCASILEQGYYKIKPEENRGINKAIEFFSEKEILFYDPLQLKVTGNSRVYEKGLELVISNW